MSQDRHYEIPEYITGTIDDNQTYSLIDQNDIQSLRNSYNQLGDNLITLQQFVEQKETEQKQHAKDFQRKIEINVDNFQFQQSSVINSLKKQIEELKSKNIDLEAKLHDEKRQFDEKLTMMEKKIVDLENKFLKEKRPDDSAFLEPQKQDPPRLDLEEITRARKQINPKEEQLIQRSLSLNEIKNWKTDKYSYRSANPRALTKQARNKFFKITIFASKKYTHLTDQEIQDNMNTGCDFNILQELHEEKEMRLGKQPRDHENFIRKGQRYLKFVNGKIFEQIDFIDGKCRKILKNGMQSKEMWIAKACEKPEKLPAEALEICEEDFLTIANSENTD